MVNNDGSSETVQVSDIGSKPVENRKYEGYEFPSTRYQGSKNGIVDWIWDILGGMDFDSFLEPFAGTSVVGFEAKKRGKKTLVNDFLDFNREVGKAIIENNGEKLSEEDITFLLNRRGDIEYSSLIQDEFQGKYFKDEENEWLDKVAVNIRHLEGRYKRAIAYSALGQACLIKRPFNLFHRANLDLRTRDVERSFGNKVTWEKSFEKAFKSFVEEYNAAVFDNERENRAYGKNVFDLDLKADLVYLDPPYLSQKSGGTDYQYYYHFLDGIINYENWRKQIDRSVKTNRLQYEKSIWNKEDEIHDAFHRLIRKYCDCKIALSYNTQGIPTVDELMGIISEYKTNVSVHYKDHQYALNKSNAEVKEVLFLAWD